MLSDKSERKHAYCITGSKGFIGSNIVNHFRDRGIPHQGFDLPEHDLTNTDTFSNLKVSDEKYTFVHAATTPMIDFEYSSVALRSNLLMAANLVVRAGERGEVINLGSGSEYSRSAWHENIREEEFGAAVPSDDHELSKYYVANLIENSKRAVNLRLFGVYGPGENPAQKFISNCIAKCLLGVDIDIYRDRRFAYVYVEDIPRFISSYRERLPGLGSLNFCSRQTFLLTELADLCREVTGAKRCKIRIKQKGFGRAYTGSTERFDDLFGNFKWTDISFGISQVYESLSEGIDESLSSQIVSDEYLKRARQKDV